MERLRDPALANIAQVAGVPLLVAATLFAFAVGLQSTDHHAAANACWGVGSLFGFLTIAWLLWTGWLYLHSKPALQARAWPLGVGVNEIGPATAPAQQDEEKLNISMETGKGIWALPKEPRDRYEDGGVFFAPPNVEIRNDSDALIDLEVKLTVALKKPPADFTQLSVLAEHTLQKRVEMAFNRWQLKGSQIVYPVKLRPGHRRVGYLVFLIDSRMAWHLGDQWAERSGESLLQNLRVGGIVLDDHGHDLKART